MYKKYASDENGNIINVSSQQIFKIQTSFNGYNQICLRMQNKQKTYLLHSFIWECFNGLIPDNKVIDHKDNNKSNNEKDNLHLMTQQEIKKINRIIHLRQIITKTKKN